MVSIPYGEEIVLEPARRVPLRVIAFGGLDASRNDRLWPEGTIPRLRDGEKCGPARTGADLYRKGLRRWKERLANEKTACIAISPTASPTGPYEDSPFVYVALGGLQEVNPQRDFRVLPNGIRGAQGCPFRIKNGDVLESPITEVEIRCEETGEPVSANVRFLHPKTLEPWTSASAPLVWERRS
jgi:hypothetical protein